jgi:hypothetical protein
VETVEPVDKIKEVVWCNHVNARGMWLIGNKPIVRISGKGVNLVVEDGTVKLVCEGCLTKAIQGGWYRKGVKESEPH